MSTLSKRFLTLLGAAFLAALPARAATLVWGAAQDNGFSNSDGSNLAINNMVRVGTFDISDTVIAQNALNLSFLDSHFIEFASGKIGDGLGFSEHFQRSDTANSGAAGLNIAGAQIYMWVFASTNNSSKATSLSSATQQGIFGLDKSVNSNWAVPVNDPVPAIGSIDISDLTNAAGTSLVTGAKVVIGSFGKGTSDQSGAPNFGLAAVPEPSSALLAVVGGTAFLVRRRRRS